MLFEKYIPTPLTVRMINCYLQIMQKSNSDLSMLWNIWKEDKLYPWYSEMIWAELQRRWSL